MGLITLGEKRTGEPCAGNPHARFDRAGAGNGVTAKPKRARSWKRLRQPRLSLRTTAPVLDPTDKRADVERTICELKNDLAIANIPSASFAANAADLAIKVLTRNLLILYRDRCLALRTRFRVATLRRRFLLVPGRIVSHAGRLILKLARDSPLDNALQAHLLRA